MSIKGIDNQMMITRATEYVRDTSAQMRKDDLTHDYLAVQTRALEEKEKQSVNKLLETQKAAVQRDDEGGSGTGGYSASSGKKEKKALPEDELPADLPDPNSPHKIDIKI